MPGGLYKRAADVTELMLKARGGSIDIHAPASFTEYFVRLYNSSDLDKRKVGDARRALDFPEVARQFKLIDDTTTGVLVPYGEGSRWLTLLLGGEQFGRGQLREMQPFMVSLYEGELRKGLASGAVTIEGDAAIHVFRGDYSETLGLTLPGEDPLQD